MSYRLDLANRAGLFSYYSSWYNENQEDDSHNNIAFQITSLILSFEKNNELAKEAVKQFSLFEKSTKIDKNSKNINIITPSLYEIFINISNIISSIRIIQNSIIDIIGKKESLSLPNSMNTFNAKIDSYRINEELKIIVKKYWEKYGSKIKDYRDINEHNNFLIKKIYIDNFKDKNLLILLPDNPNVQTYKKYTFDKQINALEFLEIEFYAIEKLLNDISQYYKYNKSSFALAINIHEENPNSLTILYDLENNTLTNIETYLENEELKSQRFLIPENIDKFEFKFIKNIQYFKNSNSFEEILKIK